MSAPTPAGSADVLVRTLSADGSVAVRALVATELVAEAVARHATAPTASAALGRTLMGALLLAAGQKDEETVQLQLRGDGPLRAITAIANAEGEVRGYVGDRLADPPPRDGKLDVGGAIGHGTLAVVRFHPSWREPYTGIVPLASGEIAEDLARYLSESEQKPAAIGLGVFVGPGTAIQAAGGFLVQALPGAEDEVLERIEGNVRALPPPTRLLRDGLDADAIVDRLLEGLGSRERHRSRPRFHCRCTRERVRQAVTLLGRAELREIAERGEPLEVRCEFCGERYELASDEVGALLPDA